MIGLISFGFAVAQTAQNQEKPVLAVLNLKASEPITENEAIQITNFLQSELFHARRFTLIDRVQVDQVLKKVSFQRSGACDVTCAAQIGKMLAAKKVIKGTVGRLGNAYTISIDMVDVETTKIENSANILERCQIEELPAFLRSLVANLLSSDPTGAPQLGQAQPKEEPGLAVNKKPEDDFEPIYIINSAKVLKESAEGKKALPQIQMAPSASQQEMRDRLNKKIKEELISIVNDIGIKNKLGAIFDLAISGIIYYDSSLDLTDVVINRYNGNESNSPMNTVSLKIAVVNAQRVLEESIEGKKAISQIQTAPSSSQQEMWGRLFKKMQEELISIVNDIGIKNKLSAIFDLGKSGLVYYDSSIDITDIVINRYNGISSSSSVNIDPFKIAVVKAQRVLEESIEGKKATSQINMTPRAAQPETQNRFYKKIQDEVISIVKDIGTKNGYGAIFDLGASGITYNDSSIDITDNLISRYDKTK
jgi:Skp family chaperone for outer membrane proteins/TolB-like protein